MDSQTPDRGLARRRLPRWLPHDWRIQWGLALTLMWFGFLALYVARNVGWSEFMDLPIEQMGTFLEGAFAFLAFLWLVIGLFIQQSVLAENNEELRRNNLHSEKQTQAIAATELNARHTDCCKTECANFTPAYSSIRYWRRTPTPTSRASCSVTRPINVRLCA